MGVEMQVLGKAVIEQYDGWWIGWIEGVPGINCQERSRAKLMETLRITLEEAIADQAHG